MKFRPCIDLHNGVVKQIVGGTLAENDDLLETNYISDKSPAWFSKLYREHNLKGGHIIKLGSGNDNAAIEALEAWPDALQIGGGITAENATDWMKKGAAAVIVTSYVFQDGKVKEENLKKLVKTVGKEKIVLDLSCRFHNGEYYIVTDRWQKFTSVVVNHETLDYFSDFCFEFLIHAVDVEGKCSGIEKDLVKLLGGWGKIPITYAGGIHKYEDIEEINRLGNGNIDFTIGSALDLFGGKGFKFDELIQL